MAKSAGFQNASGDFTADFHSHAAMTVGFLYVDTLEEWIMPKSQARKKWSGNWPKLEQDQMPDRRDWRKKFNTWKGEWELRRDNKDFHKRKAEEARSFNYLCNGWSLESTKRI